MILVLLMVLGCIIGASLLHDVIFIIAGIAVFAFCAGIYQRMAEIRAREQEQLRILKQKAREESSLKIQRELMWQEFLFYEKFK